MTLHRILFIALALIIVSASASCQETRPKISQFELAPGENYMVLTDAAGVQTYVLAEDLHLGDFEIIGDSLCAIIIDSFSAISDTICVPNQTTIYTGDGSTGPLRIVEYEDIKWLSEDGSFVIRDSLITSNGNVIDSSEFKLLKDQIRLSTYEETFSLVDRSRIELGDGSIRAIQWTEQFTIPLDITQFRLRPGGLILTNSMSTPPTALATLDLRGTARIDSAALANIDEVEMLVRDRTNKIVKTLQLDTLAHYINAQSDTVNIYTDDGTINENRSVNIPDFNNMLWDLEGGEYRIKNEVDFTGFEYRSDFYQYPDAINIGVNNLETGHFGWVNINETDVTLESSTGGATPVRNFLRNLHEGVVITDASGPVTADARIDIRGDARITDVPDFEGEVEYVLTQNLSTDVIEKISIDTLAKYISAESDTVNIYTDDGTLQENRTVTHDGNWINWTGGAFAMSGNTGSNFINGAGTRLAWIPDQAAFRAGITFGSNWDTDSIGLWSTAFGSNSIASGQGAFAFGQTNLGTGFMSFVGGVESQASGPVSFGFGGGVTASGQNSMAIGSGAGAFGHNSTSIGRSTMAESFGEISIGLYPTRYTASALTSYANEDRIFTIGNGTANDTDSLSSAMIVYKGGRNTSMHYINPGQDTLLPDVTMKIGGELQVDSLLRPPASIAGLDTANVLTQLILGENLSISGDTLNATSGNGSKEYSLSFQTIQTENTKVVNTSDLSFQRQPKIYYVSNFTTSGNLSMGVNWGLLRRNVGDDCGFSQGRACTTIGNVGYCLSQNGYVGIFSNITTGSNNCSSVNNSGISTAGHIISGNDSLIVWPIFGEEYAISSDGQNWDVLSTPFGGSPVHFDFQFLNGRFIAITDMSPPNNGAYSTDGLSWTTFDIPFSQSRQITYNHISDTYVIINNSSSGDRIAFSKDLETWDTHEGINLTNNQIDAVAALGRGFVFRNQLNTINAEGAHFFTLDNESFQQDDGMIYMGQSLFFDSRCHTYVMAYWSQTNFPGVRAVKIELKSQ